VISGYSRLPDARSFPMNERRRKKKRKKAKGYPKRKSHRIAASNSR